MAEECRFCKYTGGTHNIMSCPEAKSGSERIQLIEIWTEGCFQGRSGGENLYDACPTYTLGYLVGVVALEKADNGYDTYAGYDEEFSLDDSIVPDWQDLN